jgi:hypothetical protein
MQRLTGRSRTALAEAAGGDHLATWETVEAYVRACGADPPTWEPRWEAVRDAVRAPRAETVRKTGGNASPNPGPRPRRLHVGLAVVALAVVVAATVTYLVDGLRSPAQTLHRTQPMATGPRTIIVQNMVAIGPSGLIEDATPAYLSAQPMAFCAERHCEVSGTQMWSGHPLEATCTVDGARMTNENSLSPGIGRNKNAIFSKLWYRCILPDGKFGYLSEVYVARAYRGGLGLPTCPA